MRCFTALALGLIVLLPVPGSAEDKPRAALMETPRLVVLVSVDQMRFDYLPRLLQHLPEGGFRRLVADGATFTDAHYQYATTYTGPGHAVQLTGAYANGNGIVGNRYYDANLKKMVQPCDDAATVLVGPNKKVSGASPHNLLASTVGDELLLADRRSKMIAISLKDRASILLAGRRGQAVWFDRYNGKWVSSTYYGKSLPKWLSDFNTRKVQDAAFGKTWERRGPDAAYVSASADDVPWETPEHGLGRTFPRKITGANKKRDVSYYKAWAMSPWALQTELDVVLAAVDEEQLGQDEAPDLLAVGVSSFDYLGHAYGPHSHEMISLFFDVDEFVQKLLSGLDQRLGKGNYTIAVTADHGAAPVPEYMTQLGYDAGRIYPEDAAKAVADALTAKYGKGAWVAGIKLPLVTLNEAEITAKGHSVMEFETVAANALRQVEGVADIVSKTQLSTRAHPDTAVYRQIANSFYAERFGNLYVLPRPNWVWGYKRRKDGTGHGTPYRYDTHVPLIFYGKGVRRGEFSQPVEIIDLAPTVSELLRTTRPNQVQGRVLHEALSR